MTDQSNLAAPVENAASVPAPGRTTADAPLSPQEMSRIRAYMLKLVAIPGAALGIISALTGYIVGQHEDSAVIEKALPIITEAARQTGIANGQANSAAKEAESILNDAKSKSNDIAAVQQKVMETLKSNNDAAKSNFDQFAKELARV
jgi:hypothetical protein